MPIRPRTRGRLIVVEGSDGSGKATQSRLLVRRLLKEGATAGRIAFPQYHRTFFGRMTAAYLRGEFGSADAVDPRLASILYAGDRWEMRDKMLRRLDAGEVVVCDRYVDSNKAHQAARLPRNADRAAFLRWVDRLEYGVFGMPAPDFTLFLHVPYSTADRLISRKGRRSYLQGRRRDVHEADPAHLRKAERIYMEIVKGRRSGRAALIECVEEGRLLPRSAIAEKVWQAVRRTILPG